MAAKINRSIRSISLLLCIFLILLSHIVLADVPPPPGVGNDPPPLWLQITSKSPNANSTSQEKGTTNTFSVTLNEGATSRWFLDSAEQSSTAMSYTKTWAAADFGLHNITYIGSGAGDVVSNTWMVTVADSADNAPESSIISPDNTAIIDAGSVAFNCSATDDKGLANMTLYGNWSGWGPKKTNSLSGKNATSVFIETFSEGGDYLWNCMARDSAGKGTFADFNYTVTVNITASGGNTTDNQTGPLPVSRFEYARITLWPHVVKISPGNSIDFEVTVRNTGDVRINELYLASPDSWVSIGNNRSALDANKTKALPASLSAPLIATPGPYAVTIFLKSPNKTFDDISIPVLVIEKPGSASASTIDIEPILQGFEQARGRMSNLSRQGYNTSVAKRYIDAAESLLDNKEYLNASEQVSLANGVLNALENSRQTRQTFLKSYVIAGIGVSIMVVVSYFLYKKYLAKKAGAASIPGNVSARTNPAPVVQPAQENANVDDMIKRLREIKENVGR